MTAPIACTLAPGEYADRLRSITDLNRSALRTVARDGPALVLTYASTAAPRLRALVAQEERCCAFLTFRIDELPDAVRLTVLAPVEAADAPDALFAPLLSGAETLSAANAGSSAGCAGACACAGAPERESGNTPRGCDPAPSTAAGRAARSVPSSQRIDRLPGAAATTAAVAALACGVCCVLPFALPAVMLTAAGGVISAFADGYRWALDLSMALTAAGWLWVAWQSVRTRRRPAPSTLRAMSVATLLVAVASSWPLLEPLIRRALTA